ncbi:MAG TPA: ABC transporter permease [Blastocatellia bacterium]|nr:ABC transporter permease [Blastocatellia bacterium]
MGVLRRAFAFFKGQKLEQELDDEILFHVEMRTRDYIQSGMSPEDARRAALRLFGNNVLLKERTRSMDTINWLESFWKDIRFCAHLMIKKPGFSVAALMILALGIGLNGAIFSVVNSVLLRPLPYREPERLVQIWETIPKLGNHKEVVAPGNFIEWQTRSKSFQEMAAFNIWLPSLTGSGDPEELYGATVMTNFFSVLGVNPQMGRPFNDADVKPNTTRPVIISSSLWTRRFGRDPKIIGKPITLDGLAREVVGVMPPGFRHPELLLHKEVEIWIPIPMNPANASKGNHYMRTIARLMPGVTVEQARAEMATISQQLAEAFPDTNKDRGANVIPLHEQVTGNVRPALMILQGSVAFLLLIVCSNIAILFLSYSKAREHEVAIRSALGASAGRLVRQLFTESFMLAAIGGTLGVLLAYYAIKAFVVLAPREFPRLSEIGMDKYAIGLSVLVSLGTGLLFGLAPALQVRKAALTNSLGTGRQSAGGASGKLRNILVVAEMALTMILLTGAGLLIKNFIGIESIDPGFNPQNVLTMQISASRSRSSDTQKQTALYDEILSRVQAMPGVESAGTTLSLPIVGLNDLSIRFSVPGLVPQTPDYQAEAQYRTISPDYFKAMQIPLKSGRFFNRSDSAETPKVIIVNESMAKRYWPNEDPVGKHISTGAFGSDNSMTIVGVVGDVKHSGLQDDVEKETYVPYTQGQYFGGMAMVVRTKVKPSSLASAITKEIWSIDKDTLVSDVEPMDYVISDSIARPRFNSLVLAIFAAVALILSAIGIYGVISYSVSQRTSEIGIRMALGAKSGDVLKFIMKNGVILSAIGIGIGLGGALGLTQFLSSLLFKMSATDPITFLMVPLVLLVIVMLAIYIPARRATRVDPMIALRQD